jgi:hypothetical protein
MWRIYHKCIKNTQFVIGSKISKIMKNLSHAWFQDILSFVKRWH